MPLILLAALLWEPPCVFKGAESAPVAAQCDYLANKKVTPDSFNALEPEKRQALLGESAKVFSEHTRRRDELLARKDLTVEELDKERARAAALFGLKSKFLDPFDARKREMQAKALGARAKEKTSDVDKLAKAKDAEGAGRAAFDGDTRAGGRSSKPAAAAALPGGAAAGGALKGGAARYSPDGDELPILVSGGSGVAARSGGPRASSYAVTDKGLEQPWLQQKLAKQSPESRAEFEKIHGVYVNRVVENREKGWGYGKKFDYWDAADYGWNPFNPKVKPIEERSGKRPGVCDEWSEDIYAKVGAEHKNWVVEDVPRENASSHYGVAVYPKGKTKADGVVFDAWENGTPEVHDYATWNKGTWAGRAATWYGDSWVGRAVTFD